MTVGIAEQLVADCYQQIAIIPTTYAQLAERVEAAFDERLAERSQAIDDLTTKHRLESEADKLLEAHFADAIDLPTLKRHQDRIRITLADVTKRLDAERHDHDGPRQHLATALRLLADCAQMYEHTDDHGKRLANQAFYQRILITEDEKAAIQLNEPFAALAPTSTDVRCSNTSNLVDLAGGLSKLAPPLVQMVRVHQSIRARWQGPQRRRRQPRRSPRASEGLLQRAEAAYAAGGSLKAVARQVGLGHERLARLLRERGVILRNHSPSTSEIRLMRAMYEQGASLERVGDRFGYTAGTVRTHLIIAGVVMRDTHGRGRVLKAQQDHR